MRVLMILAGLSILGSATWAVIVSAGLPLPEACLLASMAAGTAAAAAAIGRRHWAVGAVIVLAVLAGEAYGVAQTAERVLRQREQLARTEAAGNPRLAAALEALERATAAVTKHDADAKPTLAQRHCGRECRAGLEATRGQLVADREAARQRVDSLPSSARSPLAAWLEIDNRAVDLAMAALLAFGANGLAGVLIAIGAHGWQAPQPAPKREPLRVEPAPEPQSTAVSAVVVPMLRRARKADAETYMTTHAKPRPGVETPLGDIVRGYWGWCDGNRIDRPDMATAIRHMAVFIASAGLDSYKAADGQIMVQDLEMVA